MVCGLGWTFVSGAFDAWIANEVGDERLVSLSLLGLTGLRIGAPVVGTVGLRLALRAAMVTVGMLLSPLLALFGVTTWRPAASAGPAAWTDGLEG